MNNLISIPFHNQTLTAINHKSKPYIAMRPIVENLGLNWKTQYRKINEKFSSSVVIMTTEGARGMQREFICLPVSKIAGFLYSINASKVKPELRETILLYQDKCDEVLDDYFMGQAQHAAEFNYYQYQKLLVGIYRNHPLWRTTALLRQIGHTYKQIAKRINRHPSTVGRMLKKMASYGIDCQPIRALAA